MGDEGRGLEDVGIFLFLGASAIIIIVDFLEYSRSQAWALHESFSA